MKFLKETGIILNNQHEIMHVIEGHSSSVEFHADLLLRIHKQAPGSIFCLAHTHPAGMIELSSEDKTTLRALTMVLAPFPIRMATVAQVTATLFQTTIYVGLYQSIEDYLYQGEKKNRKFEIIKEQENIFSHPKLSKAQTSIEADLLVLALKDMATWEKLIVEKSFIEENHN